MPMAGDLLQQLRIWTERDPEVAFLQTRDQLFTRQSFWNTASDIAARLQGELADPGSDLVGIHEDDPANFFCYLTAVWMTGRRALPLNTRMPERIIDSCIAKARCDVVIGSVADTPAGVRCDYLPMGSSAGSGSHALEISQHDSAIVMFTSGSTGVPKAIPLTFRQIVLNARLTSEVTGLDDGDRMLITMPPYFASGICHFVTCVVQGAGLVAVTGFNFGEQLIALIDERGITAFGGSPTNVRRMLGAAQTGEELPNVRFWVSSGDYLTAAEQEHFRQRFPHVRLVYIYGLSEVGGRLCINDVAANPGKVGSAGPPLPGMEVEILSTDDGSRLGPNEVGEINVKGPLLMDGYLLDDGEIDRSCVDGGFSTGDLGRIDADGFVWIVGRTDDVIKIGGEKVSVINVEDAIRTCAPCRDCCVAVIDDERLGSVLIGLIAPESEEAGVDLRDLLRQLRHELPPNALPAKVFIVDDIPRTGSGKVARQAARDLAHSLLHPR